MLIDSHSHFDDASFDHDRAAALARAHGAGVIAQILPAVSQRLWPKLKAVADPAQGLYPAYGLHPCYLPEHRPEHLDELVGWLERECPVAVGECGLDFFQPELDPVEQERYFLAQLKLARDFDLPVIIHARRAVDQVLKCIRRVGHLRGVVHSFSGSAEQARRLRELGFLVSFGGPITYERANRLRTLVKTLPADSFLLETDAPDQPGVLHRGTRNEPAFLPEVLAVVAELRGESPQAVAAATSCNAIDLFGLPCPLPALA
ncbi:MAG TPA: TatD family hydrolase [Candidatus Competibacteraceae bacterium]|nr:TatD family hydrolase [Candidatus Competibacteraceae bacterium]